MKKSLTAALAVVVLCLVCAMFIKLSLPWHWDEEERGGLVGVAVLFGFAAFILSPIVTDVLGEKK